jgi:hypothetical protein
MGGLAAVPSTGERGEHLEYGIGRLGRSTFFAIRSTKAEQAWTSTGVLQLSAERLARIRRNQRSRAAPCWPDAGADLLYRMVGLPLR